MTGPWVIRLGEEEVFMRLAGYPALPARECAIGSGSLERAMRFRTRDAAQRMLADLSDQRWRVVSVNSATAQRQTRYEAGCMAGMVEGSEPR